MSTFDHILPQLEKVLQDHKTVLEEIRPFIVNRDLFGRVGFIVNERWQDDERLKVFAREVKKQLGPHAFDEEEAFLWEENVDPDTERGPKVELRPGVWLVDRLAVESDWTWVLEAQADSDSMRPRIAFYSLKGGVGRSTALAVAAWAFAGEGKRVLVVDLDLEAPGLSALLLPENRLPAYGVVDWLVEDLVDNGDVIVPDMVASSPLGDPLEGDILVVPAHGRDAGAYVLKLGRVWMPKRTHDDSLETWPVRLARLMYTLETETEPDIVLLDVRAGLDETASAALMALNPYLILLFAVEGDQTWTGYRLLFRHWETYHVVKKVWDRLRVVASTVPADEQKESYIASIRENAWKLFSETIYTVVDELYNDTDPDAPHYPWPIYWDRSLLGVPNIYTQSTIQPVFDEFLTQLKAYVEIGEV